MSIEIEKPKPWYKQPWLWLVMSIPIASVILSSIMITIAIVGRDSLVDDNYYKDGMGINQIIEKDLQADALGLMPVVNVNDKQIIVKLESRTHAISSPAFLSLKLLHPTLADKDVSLKLLPTQNNIYVGEAPNIIIGKRYLELSDFEQSWRIREEVSLPLKQQILNQGAFEPKNLPEIPLTQNNANSL